ncbi:hypothetical protein [Pseudactinotalea sp. Z1748]|uniref:hypothetical protein n=1 Tax=Pseudactinotalea sp. Z1748 TaxID=3413027 RepID=UPI003C7B6AB9
MTKAKKRKPDHTYALDAGVVAKRMAHRSSGAAGVHADQNARRQNAGGRTNRVGSRSAARRAAIRAAG